MPCSSRVMLAPRSDVMAENVERWASKGHMSLSHVPRSIPSASSHQIIMWTIKPYPLGDIMG